MGHPLAVHQEGLRGLGKGGEGLQVGRGLAEGEEAGDVGEEGLLGEEGGGHVEGAFFQVVEEGHGHEGPAPLVGGVQGGDPPHPL